MKTRGESGLRSLPLKIVFGPPLQMLCVVVVVNAMLSGPALTFWWPSAKKIMEAPINYKNIKSQIGNRHDK